MKILQTKISNVIAYLLLVFAVASSALFLYGQFYNFEFENIDNTSTEVTPIGNSIETDTIVGEVETLPLDEGFLEPNMESDTMTPETSIVETLPILPVE